MLAPPPRRDGLDRGRGEETTSRKRCVEEARRLGAGSRPAAKRRDGDFPRQPPEPCCDEEAPGASPVPFPQAGKLKDDERTGARRGSDGETPTVRFS